MSQNIEIEFKNILKKDEFNRLTTHFQLKDTDFFTQINHYFDTKEFSLKKLGCALRIREKNNSYEMTLKQPHTEGLLETNQTLSPEVARSLLDGEPIGEGIIQNTISKMGIPTSELIYFGTLLTKRAEISFKEGLLVLDYSSYLNTEDYEVEYEVNDREKGELLFLKLLDDMQIPIRQTKNKVRRFYDRKKESMEESTDA